MLCRRTDTVLTTFLFGQRLSDALEATLDSDDILPANLDSHEQRQERRRLALHALIASVSAARFRRNARGRTRKHSAWQPGELCVESKRCVI